MTDPRYLAHEIVVSITDGTFTIDGTPLPWYIGDGWNITGDVGGIAFLNVAIFAEKITVTETPKPETR